MRHLNNLKYMAMALFVAMLSLSFTACSDDDDDEISGLNNYYISCTNASGGGLSAQEIDVFISNMNSSLSSMEMTGVEYAEAVYVFSELMKTLEESFSDGMSGINGTLTVTFALKTEDGKTAKTATLAITKDGSNLSI